MTTRQKDVRYSLVYDASDYIQDHFWKAMIQDISKSRCPKKVSIDNTTIYIGTKRSQTAFFYSNKTPEEIALELVPLLRDQLHILSKTDLHDTSDLYDQQFNDFIHKTQENCWKKIKNKKMKCILLVNYTLRQKKEWNLCWPMTRKLYQVIENALFTFHTHTADDIQMTDGIISSIEDIIWDGKDILNTRYATHEMPSSYDEEEKESNVIDLWNQYIKSLSDEC